MKELRLLRGAFSRSVPRPAFELYLGCFPARVLPRFLPGLIRFRPRSSITAHAFSTDLFLGFFVCVFDNGASIWWRRTFRELGCERGLARSDVVSVSFISIRVSFRTARLLGCWM